MIRPAVVAWFIKALVQIQLNECLGGNTLSQFQLQNAGSLGGFMIHALAHQH